MSYWDGCGNLRKDNGETVFSDDDYCECPICNKRLYDGSETSNHTNKEGRWYCKSCWKKIKDAIERVRK